jgi:hypothetical protein
MKPRTGERKFFLALCSCSDGGRGFGRGGDFGFGLFFLPFDVAGATNPFLGFVVLFAHINLYFANAILFGTRQI